MNLAWTFGDFVSPKTAPTRTWRGILSLGALGEQQGGYRNRLRKVFSRSLMLLSPKRQARPPVLRKHLAISPIPLPFVAAP